MRTICSSLQTPVIVILLLILGFTAVLLGSLIAEGVFERRHLKIWMPQLVDYLRKGIDPPALCIKKSGLLKRQKVTLIEITDHKELTEPMREALAVRLTDRAKERYTSILNLSNIIIRIGPVFGLLGTLIPLGPGILALGQGDTYTLSQSLLTAFDTTVLGLVSAAVCAVISIIRKKWYTSDMSILETLMECILEVEKEAAEDVAVEMGIEEAMTFEGSKPGGEKL